MKKRSTKNSLTTRANLEDRFESGKDVLDHFDVSSAEVIETTRRVAIDVPQWALVALDLEANRRGIARQALIKMWVVDKLDELKKSA